MLYGAASYAAGYAEDPVTATANPVANSGGGGEEET